MWRADRLRTVGSDGKVYVVVGSAAKDPMICSLRPAFAALSEYAQLRLEDGRPVTRLPDGCLQIDGTDMILTRQ